MRQPGQSSYVRKCKRRVIRNSRTSWTGGSIGWCTTCSTSTRDPVYMYLGYDIWSDSQIVLYWLSTTKHLTRFVHNRVEEINRLTCRLPWRYCPTDDNPADLHTCGVSANAYHGNQLWYVGLAWLPNRDQWPIWEYNQSTVQMLPEDAVDAHRQPTAVSSLQCIEIPGIQRVINETNYMYSTYKRLLRVTAYTCRFIDNCNDNDKEQTELQAAWQQPNCMMLTLDGWNRVKLHSIKTK